MLPCAGKVSMFKYSLLIDTVKKFKLWSESAGKTFILKSGTSETIRNNTEKIQKISIHLPKHLKPLNDEQFGHYLAGLFDVDGYFSTQLLIIKFNYLNVELAHNIKEIIGFGHVKKAKTKSGGYLYIIHNKDGILRTINLINGKLRTKHKFRQIRDFQRSHPKYDDYNIIFTMNKSNNLNNYWLAGFCEQGASFNKKIINTITGYESPDIKLNFQIAFSVHLEEDKNILLMIKEFFGGKGKIWYTKHEVTFFNWNVSIFVNSWSYYYRSTSFDSFKKVVDYFDTFHLQSSKYINYLKWRKSYILIQEEKNKEITVKGGMN